MAKLEWATSHVRTTVARRGGIGSFLRGELRYEDLRPDPPGDAAAPFRCAGAPTSIRHLARASVHMHGTIQCGGFFRAVAFSIVVVDHGPNPPSADSYHLILFDREGSTIYDWRDSTTVGLGDLRVRAG